MHWPSAAVHTFTASGAVCGFFATLAVFDRAPETMFFWLGTALIIDGIDGIFARAVEVEKNLPRFSGERLDLVVDYVTYVFVPALALVRWGYLEGTTGQVLAVLILLSSLYHFADTQSKTADNAFNGFPAIWNIVAFYVFAFAPSPRAAAALVAVGIVTTFLPLPFVHPWRGRQSRTLTITASLAFAAAALSVLSHGLPANGWEMAVLAAVAAYGLTLTAHWGLRR